MPEVPAEKARIEQLRKEIFEHDERYYRHASPTISDHEYDLLKAELKRLETEFPEFAQGDSPTQKIGDDRSGAFEKYRHRVPMQSLENTYNEGEFLAFCARVEKEIPPEKLGFVVEPKIDGLSVSYTYEDGKFVRATTRGNGTEGDDISRHIGNIAGVPDSLSELPNGKPVPKILEIRGEIFMRNEEFRRINKEREDVGLELFANPRNLAAGTIKSKNPEETRNRKLDTFVYGLGACDPEGTFATLEELREALKAWGFPVPNFFEKAKDGNDAFVAIEKLRELRKNFSYPTDGAVVKVTRTDAQRDLGEKINAPRWAIAFKYPPEQVETTLCAITLQVGRTGKITPVAELEPVEIAGTVVARATLHNEDEIAAKDLRVGDRVIVEKAGEIIPQVVRSLPEKRSAESKKFSFADAVRTAGLDAERPERLIDPKHPEKGTGKIAAWYLREKDTPELRKRRLIYFVGKTCMDIPNLGEAIVSQLIDLGLVHEPADIYRLTKEDLLSLDKIKGKSAQKLLDGIEASRSRDLRQLVNGLGIPNVGETTARDLANHFKTLDALMEADAEGLAEIYGIGEVVAQSVCDFFASPRNRAHCEALKLAGVNTVAKNSVLPELTNDNPFAGGIFVLTGMLPTLKRDDAKRMIEALGGKCTDSVSSKTSCVLAGSDAGSKLEKAQQLGVPVIDEETFWEWQRRALGGKTLLESAVADENYEVRQTISEGGKGSESESAPPKKDSSPTTEGSSGIQLELF